MALSDFAYNRDITIDTSVAGISSSVSDFLFRYEVNSSSWTNATERGHFFDSSNVGGKRVQFYDSDGVTPLDYAVVKYDDIAEDALYVIRIPTLTTAIKTIKVGYGSDPSGTDQDDPAGALPNHRGYWPLGDTYGAQDLSANNNHGTVHGAVSTAGVFGQGYDFDGVDDYIEVADADSLSFGDGLTDTPFTVLFNAAPDDATPSFQDGLVGKQANEWFVHLRVSSPVAGALKINVTDASNGSWVGAATNVKVFSDGVSARAAVVYDGTAASTGYQAFKIYIDGISKTVVNDNSSGTYVAMENTADSFLIGALTPATQYFGGLLDEVEVIEGALSADYIKADNTGFDSTGGFVGSAWTSLGAEQSGGTPTTAAVPICHLMQGGM